LKESASGLEMTNFRKTCGVLLVATGIMAAAPVLAQSSGAEDAPPVDRSYKLLRQDEDWSFLQDPSLRSDFWDPLKYIRLRPDEADWYLTIGGEAREVWEQIGNDDWGQFPYMNGDCHTILDAETAYPEVSYPPETKCMQCHETVAKERPAIEKLAEYYNVQKPVPWVQIYALPEFVYFTHKVHCTKAKIACSDCHGPVAERDVITREKPITMMACLDCHRETRAPVKCNTCHNPNP
jgi:hypothetical protein